MTVLHTQPFGAAPAEVFSAPNPSAVRAKYGSLVAALFGSTRRYQGYYIEIRGSNQKPYIRRSVSFVTGSGRLWESQSLGVSSSR